MSAVRHAARLSLALGVAILSSANAEAQGLVRYVSSFGNDGNPCTRTQPCRTLQAGVNAAPSGGEVQFLDSGEFGADATIGKALTVSATGVSATVLGTITIDAPTNAAIVLRGLHLNGRDVVAQGIRIVQAKSIHIKDCLIERFDGDGVSGAGAIFVVDSTLRDNGDDGLYMYYGNLLISNSRFVNNGGSGLLLFFSDTTMTNVNASANFLMGVDVSAGRAIVSRSIAANNGQYGFVADLGEDIFLFKADLTVSHSVARGNQRGLFSHLTINLEGGLRVSNSVVTNNVIGIANSGIVETRQNNIVSGNGTDLAGPALTPLPPM